MDRRQLNNALGTNPFPGMAAFQELVQGQLGASGQFGGAPSSSASAAIPSAYQQQQNFLMSSFGFPQTACPTFGYPGVQSAMTGFGLSPGVAAHPSSLQTAGLAAAAAQQQNLGQLSEYFSQLTQQSAAAAGFGQNFYATGLPTSAEQARSLEAAHAAVQQQQQQSMSGQFHPHHHSNPTNIEMSHPQDSAQTTTRASPASRTSQQGGATSSENKNSSNEYRARPSSGHRSRPSSSAQPVAASPVVQGPPKDSPATPHSANIFGHDKPAPVPQPQTSASRKSTEQATRISEASRIHSVSSLAPSHQTTSTANPMEQLAAAFGGHHADFDPPSAISRQASQTPGGPDPGSSFPFPPKSSHQPAVSTDGTSSTEQNGRICSSANNNPFAQTSNDPSNQHQHSNIDALDSVFSTLEDLGELNPHLLGDAFFGESAPGEADLSKIPTGENSHHPLGSGDGPLLPSLFEYDPSTLNAQGGAEPGTAKTSGQPSTTNDGDAAGSSDTAGSNQQNPSTTESSVTPKLREKFKMRREKELAELDKVFDWHLSRVMEKNEKAAASLAQIALPPMPFDEHGASAPNPARLPGDPSSSKQFQLSEQSNEGARPSTSMFDESGGGSPIRFSPVHFSPNPSPPPAKSAALAKKKADPPAPLSDEVQVFIPIPEMRKIGNKATKVAVPIYKQNKGANGPGGFPSSIRGFNKKPEQEKKEENVIKNEDSLYCFTDDEDDKKDDVVGHLMENMKERKLEEEVNKKLLHISRIHPELRRNASQEGKSGEDLWKHVVPKKRHGNSKANADAGESQGSGKPSAPLLPPSSSQEGSQGRQKGGGSPGSGERESSGPMSLAAQLAETLRKRREIREKHSFVRTEVILDNSTATPSPSSGKKDEKALLTPGEIKQEIQVSLPKVIIRIPKKLVEDMEPPEIKKHKKKKKKHKHKHREGEEGRKKKKKKKKRKSDDKDYDPGPSLRKRLRTNSSKKSSGSESEDDAKSEEEQPSWEANQNTAVAEPSSPHYSKKGKKDWIQRFDRKVELPKAELKAQILHDAEEAAATDQRLSQFRQPGEDVQKGTFLVSKEDIGKEDCPLWRVDNQNLLQKFPPFDRMARIAYKSSSTYSGWAAQNSDHYMVVQVRYIQHTRSESIVEPEIPLVDLFPAVSTEISGNGNRSELLFGGSLSPPECDQHRSSHIPVQDQPLKDALDTYLQALLLHALSGNFLESIRQQTEWKYLRHLNDVDSLNMEKKGKLLGGVRWDEKFKDVVESYSHCSTSDGEGAGLTCQACHGRPAERVVQLFANECYDLETLEPRPTRVTSSGSPLPSQEYLVCPSCADVATMYHKLFHLRYHMYKRCEDKIEMIREDDPDAEPAVVLERCLSHRTWVSQSVNQYLELWQKVK